MQASNQDCLLSCKAKISALEFTGSYKGITGHDNVTRTLVREFCRRGLRVNLHDLPEWGPTSLPLSKRDPWFDQLNTEVNAAHHLFLCMPHQVADGPANVKRINYTMFEADRIPALWVEHSKKHDLIIVPVNACKQAWIESGVPEDKLAVCPLGVDFENFNSRQEPLELAFTDGRGLSEFRFRFLNVADSIERKNLFSLLRAWICSTSADDDAVLILKPGFYASGSRSRFFSSLRALEIEIGKKLEQAAPIFFLDSVLKAEDMPRLYSSATHYVSASRGEGFDLPMTEAAASGLQLIAPRHSAYLDYLNDDIAYMISATPVRAVLPGDAATQTFFAGAYWWEPNLEELSAVFQSIISGQTASKTGAKQAIAALSWERTAERITELISAI